MRFIIRSLAAVILFLSALTRSAHAEPVFTKGAEVWLTKGAPLLFKYDATRTGKAGERFIVIQHNVSAKRVFVLSKDAAGKEIALNVSEDAVEFAPFDIVSLRASLLQFSDRADIVSASAAIGAAVTRAPADARIQGYRTAVVQAKEAQDKVAVAAQNAEETKKRVAQLSKSAWAAASSRLDPNGGFARSQQMKAEADKLIADSTAQMTAAKNEWDTAKRNLSAVLAPIPQNTSSSDASLSSGAPKPKPDSAPANVVSNSALAAVAKPSKPSSQQAPEEFLHLVETSADASKETQLEKGTIYNITGKYAPYFQIMQIAGGAIFVADASSRNPSLVAVLIPENESVLETVNIGTFGNGSPYGFTARAVGAFVSFKDFPLASGASRRLPVFQIPGLNFYDGKFINMAATK